MNDKKAMATLIARFAFGGFAVHQLADGGFVVCRGNQARYCRDFEALAACARMLEAV